MSQLGTSFALSDITSAVLVSNLGFSGYSNGGLTGTITGIACAAYYR